MVTGVQEAWVGGHYDAEELGARVCECIDENSLLAGAFGSGRAKMRSGIDGGSLGTKFWLSMHVGLRH